MRIFLLKAGATLLTMVTTLASAMYVTAHLKNPNAPLRPPVLSAGTGTTVTTPFGGSLTLTPGVRAADVQPVSSTYAS
jgi:hypothetical protein